MAEYCVNHEAEEKGNIIHLIHCADAPAADNSRYIGSYGNPIAAYKDAMGYYHAVDYCPSCLASATKPAAN